MKDTLDYRLSVGGKAKFVVKSDVCVVALQTVFSWSFFSLVGFCPKMFLLMDFFSPGHLWIKMLHIFCWPQSTVNSVNILAGCYVNSLLNMLVNNLQRFFFCIGCS